MERLCSIGVLIPGAESVCEHVMVADGPTDGGCIGAGLHGTGMEVGLEHRSMTYTSAFCLTFYWCSSDKYVGMLGERS